MIAGPARYVIAVGSGKGGVGKSTISLNLALALREQGSQVGLLDADFYGPDIPLMLNIARSKRLERWNLWSARGLRLDPVERHGLQIMSVGFLLAEEQALAWPGHMVEFVARQLIADVEWGSLDFLIVDLPPGTADVQQQLLELLPLAGALVIVSPQDVAHLDARRLVELLRDRSVRVLGGVENMSGLACPHCGGTVEVFPRVAEARSLWAHGVEKLAEFPLDPEVAAAGERGRPLLVERPDGAQADLFRDLADRVVELLAA